jgi:uncharacterized protein (DUF1330 family)
MLSRIAAGLMVLTVTMSAQAEEASPPKAYVIGEVMVSDPEGYKAYVAAVTPIVARFGDAYLARGGKTVPVEGAPPAGRVVIVQFPSVTAVEAFEKSPEGMAAAALRHKASTGRFFVVEGVAP